ncbi:Uncharacterised protein [Escherichia coli]|uniref:Uncharacterized protein n=1 Tax=Escherichia coli TaxID=562 RepID=A0A376TKD9_ECOLX|nr:Uncharacterised protein [Escherichia coli]
MNNVMAHTRRYICWAGNSVIFTPGIHEPVTCFGAQPSPSIPPASPAIKGPPNPATALAIPAAQVFAAAAASPTFAVAPTMLTAIIPVLAICPVVAILSTVSALLSRWSSSANFSCALFFRHLFVLPAELAGLFILRHSKTKIQ